MLEEGTREMHNAIKRKIALKMNTSLIEKITTTKDPMIGPIAAAEDQDKLKTARALFGSTRVSWVIAESMDGQNAAQPSPSTMRRMIKLTGFAESEYKIAMEASRASESVMRNFLA